MAVVQQTYRDNELDALFPTPSYPPHVLAPARYPGPSAETVEALIRVLKDNHTKHHIFFHDKPLHNHISHRALALYSIGASGSLIEEYYKQDSGRQRLAITPPEAITEKNFIDHLGDNKYYFAYKNFFTKVLEEKGLSATLEEYVFSKKYNFIDGRDASAQPALLSRFLGSAFHAFIHVGYGAEMGIPGMVVEGLGMASVHENEFLPPHLFDPSGIVEKETSRLASLFLNAKTSPASSRLERQPRNHAFSILAKIQQDPEFSRKEVKKYFKDLEGLMSTHGDTVWRYAEEWTIDVSQPGEIERKMEECIWANAIIYTVGGWKEGKGFTADFIFMHLVTPTLFLTSLLPYLTQKSQIILLRAYFASTLGWWIARGFPSLDIQGFVNGTSHLSESSEDKVTNEFLDIVQSAITHPNDHMSKIQRAFAHFSSIYGTRPKGYFKDTGLEGAEALDGSLFLRAARLTEEWTDEGRRPFSQEAFPVKD